MEGVTIRNYTGPLNPVFPIISSSQQNNALLSFQDFVIEDSKPQNQQLYGGSPSLSNITITSFKISNCTLNSGIGMLFFFTLHQINVDGFDISGVKFNDPTDTETSLITLNLIDINNTYESVVNNVSYMNSSTTLMKIGKFANSLTGTKSIKFMNSIFKDSEISSGRSLIPMNKITSQFKLEFSFDNITFSGIKFTSGGYLLKFDHQFPTNVSVTN